MKRMMSLTVALIMALLPLSALAAGVQDSLYSLAPANPTQENVEMIQAKYLPDDQEKRPCAITVMEPTGLTVDTLKDIFDFVDVDQQPPARYFPETVQDEIAQIISGDPDRLYMPEFMSLMLEEKQLDADVHVDMHMYIDYQEGQMVVPVLGRETEAGIEWKPLPAEVIDRADNDNMICYVVPADVFSRYAGAETLFALLAEKPGSGEWETEQVMREETVYVPSKNASNIIFVADEVVRNAAGEAVDCKIIIVPQTEPIKREVEKMSAFFFTQENPPVRYFDEETVQEASLILTGTAVDTLLPYEVTQVMAVDYQEPYGDVMARFVFPTPFVQGKAIIAFIGMPDEQDESSFHWMPLHAEKVDNMVEITFSSSVLPAMMERAGLLLVMSEPIEE